MNRVGMMYHMCLDWFVLNMKNPRRQHASVTHQKEKGCCDKQAALSPAAVMPSVWQSPVISRLIAPKKVTGRAG